MNQDILKHSITIFDTQDKWDALFEIQSQIEKIIDYWLTLGARSLRKSFADHPVWGCEEWDSPRDTRWFLKDIETQSLGIGFGWPEVELHLHLMDISDDIRACASELLTTAHFNPLLELFELQTPPIRVKEGCLAYNARINPFSDTAEAPKRVRELAWLAAHQTELYVQQMGGVIRRLTDDPFFTGLFRELHQQIHQKSMTNQKLPQ